MKHIPNIITALHSCLTSPKKSGKCEIWAKIGRIMRNDSANYTRSGIIYSKICHFILDMM